MTDPTPQPESQQSRRLHLVGAANGEGPGDSTTSPAVVSPDTVIALREGGRSYAAIARQLTMSSSVQAQAAFVRAIRQRPREERADLVERELGRLDDLEKRIRARADQNPDKASQHLVALEKLRFALQ
jgi:hypothetical protein